MDKGTEMEMNCIRCGGPNADEECVDCGNISCNAHSEYCEGCEELFCFECFAKHNNCGE